MKKQLSFLITAVFLWNTAANGAPVVNGTLDTAIYGGAIAIQTVNTQFGDNYSELDAAYATIVSNKLYLMLTGNLENNWNKLEIFIDSTDAVTTNKLIMAGNDGTGALDGLIFDTGFSPDYNFHVRHSGTEFYIDFSDLASQSFVQYGPFFGGSSQGSAVTSTSAINASVIGVGFNNSNTAGIGGGTGAADPAAAASVLTGLELCIDLADIGNPAQTIKIAALINSSENDYLSNQMLGGLPAGTDNPGAPGAVDLNNFSGNQFFTITVPAELSCELSDSMSGNMEVGETNTVSITISNLSGIASNITSTLTFAPAGGLSVISSNTPAGPLGGGDSLIHTYDVVAGSNGVYVLTAKVSTNGTVCITNTFNLTVGQQVRYDSYSITNESGGYLAGKVEPDESFDLIITSINDGAGAVSDITNSLTADPAYFGISPAFDIYGSLAHGESTSTVYRVTCAAGTPDGQYLFTVVNRTSNNVWTNQFELDVFRRAVPSVSDSALTIRLAPGQTQSGSVTLRNDGNLPTPFTVTTDVPLPVFYTAETQSISRISFWDADFQPDTVFNSWTGTDSDPMSIGFGFSLFGTEYTSFSASQHGFLTLGNTNGAAAKLIPFQTTAIVDQSTIRYDRVKNGLLVVAWGNDSGKEFQLWLHADGTIDYLYEFGTWGSGAIGLSAGSISQTLSYVGNDTLHLAPETWVSFTPASGTLVGFGSTRLLTFTADATAVQSPGTYEFTATVDWGGTSDEIDVTVIVEDPYIQLDVPATFAFSGPAGTISSPAILTVTNSGNVPLTYSITDTGLRDAGYTSEAVDYQWRHIPETIDTVLSESKLDPNSVTIGFPFVFYGRTFTNLTVHDSGFLTFDDGSWIAPYSLNTGLLLDNDSQIRILTDTGLNHFTLTWENMAPLAGGENKTFQVVLNRDGTFLLTYQQFAEMVESVEEIPITETTYETNAIGNFVQILEVETVVGTNTVTNYTENIVRRSFEFTPGQSRIITFSPVSGTIPAGEPADITLRGDARGLTGAGTNDVSTGTTLTFFYGSTNALVDVSFTATNSVETAYPSAAVAAAMWGTDAPIISSWQNPDGSRILSWPAAQDDSSRTYTIWYTTSLGAPWTLLNTTGNATSYVDDQHNDEPVIFYKVTVQ